MSERNAALEEGRLKRLPIIAVDIGNACVKLGRFNADYGLHQGAGYRAAAAGKEQLDKSSLPALPTAIDTLSFVTGRLAFDQLSDWLGRTAIPVLSWWIGSVNRPTTTILLDWLRNTRPHDPVRLLASTDLPLVVRLPEPDRVGVDRLLDAVAANVLRKPGRAAVVVDVGTAITVDLLASDGAFCGGAILPGMAISAKALSEFTDLLPEVDVTEFREPPSPVGKSTVEAMQSGLFWFAVGAIRELATRMTVEQELPAGLPASGEPHLFLTGGASAAVSGLLGSQACLLPHLTLAGIALTAQASTLRSS